MKLGFDIRPFLKEETGVGIYFKNLLFHLSRLDTENEYYLFSSSFKDRFAEDKIPPFRRLHMHDFRLPVKLINFLWHRLGRPRLDRFFKEQLDLTHSPTPLPLPTAGRKVVTVYDLFFMNFPEQADPEARKVFSRKIGSSLPRADAVVSISEFTRNQILDRFAVDPAMVRTIHLGLDREFWAEKDEEACKALSGRLGLPEGFILFVGALEKRKNITGLLDALKVIHSRWGKLPLVLAGRKGEDSQEVRKKAEALGLASSLIFTGYRTEKELRSLYGLADLFVFPSLWEGFGLPLLEAMASGLPVAASRRTAIPEIAGDAALYFDPENPEDMADRIIRGIEQTELRKNLVGRGLERAARFSWTRTAEESLALYREIV
jgi:glycosyltransferase involved in cell wall biosynthesis